MTNPVTDRRRRRRIGKWLFLIGIAPLAISILLSIIEAMLGGFLLIPPSRLTGPTFRADEVGLESLPQDARVRMNFVARCVSTSGEAEFPWHMQREYTISAVWFARGEVGAGRALSDEHRDFLLTTQRESLGAYLRTATLASDTRARAGFTDMLKKGVTVRTVTGYVWPNVPHAIRNVIRRVDVPFLGPILCGVGAGLWSSGRKRIPPGFCVKCGYDLRGSPLGSGCPECGNNPVARRSNPSEP